MFSEEGGTLRWRDRIFGSGGGSSFYDGERECLGSGRGADGLLSCPHGVDLLGNR